MRSVILLDRSFARRERDLLSRLEIGLADEGVRVIHAVPREIVESESVGLYSSSIGYDDRGFPTTDGARVRELVAAIARVTDSDAASAVDVVHCFGAGREKLAIDLAAALDAAAMIEVWQVSSLAPAAEACRRDPARTTLLFPDTHLRAAMTRTFSDAHAGDAPWGVHAGARHSLAGDEGPDHPTAPSVALLADGAHPAMLDSALKGLADAVAADGPTGALSDLLIFVDTDRARSPRMWQLARKHGLLDRLSIVPGIEARREPILRLDALLVPEPSGRFRSIVLDAMARGLPVLAAPDPSLSILSDPSIARLVAPATAEAWSAAVRGIFAEAPARHALTHAAREFVRTSRSASAHVAAVLKAYESAIARRAAAKQPTNVA